MDRALNQSGFMLAELLIAVFVILMAALFSTNFMINSSRSQKGTTDTEQAYSTAAAVICSLQTATSPSSNCKTVMAKQGGTTFNACWNITTITDLNMRRADVTIDWQAGSRNRSVTLSGAVP